METPGRWRGPRDSLELILRETAKEDSCSSMQERGRAPSETVKFQGLTVVELLAM